MRSLWTEIEYVKIAARPLDRNCINIEGSDLFTEALWVSVDQRLLELRAVKIRGQKKILPISEVGVQESSSTFDTFYLYSKWPHFNSTYVLA